MFRNENRLIYIIMLSEFWAPWEYKVNLSIYPCHPSIRYQINARTELAVRYNDISPLENHHCAVAFQILSLPECNIFANVDLEAFKQIRQVIRQFIASMLSLILILHCINPRLLSWKRYGNVLSSFAFTFPGNYHPHSGHRHGQTRRDTRLF